MIKIQNFINGEITSNSKEELAVYDPSIGEVISSVVLSNTEDFNNARKNILKNLDRLNWSGGFYRKDIGYKVIDL